MTTTPEELFKALKVADDVDRTHDLCQSLHDAIFGSLGQFNTALLSHCWPMILEMKESNNFTVLICLTKILTDTCKHDNELLYISSIMPVTLDLLTNSENRVVCAASEVACHAIPRALEFIRGTTDTALARQAWDLITSMKTLMVANMSSLYTTICLSSFRFLQTTVINFSAPKSSIGYQKLVGTSQNPHTVMMFDITRIPPNHPILNSELMNKDAGTILILLLRKLNSTSSDRSASVIVCLLALLYQIILSQPQFTSLIVDAIVYFHTYNPYLLPKTQRKSIKHVLRTIMNNIKTKNPGKWNDILDQCLSGTIQRGAGGSKRASVIGMTRDTLLQPHYSQTQGPMINSAWFGDFSMHFLPPTPFTSGHVRPYLQPTAGLNPAMAGSLSLVKPFVDMELSNMPVKTITTNAVISNSLTNNIAPTINQLNQADRSNADDDPSFWYERPPMTNNAPIYPNLDFYPLGLMDVNRTTSTMANEKALDIYLRGVNQSESWRGQPMAPTPSDTYLKLAQSYVEAGKVTHRTIPIQSAPSIFNNTTPALHSLTSTGLGNHLITTSTPSYAHLGGDPYTLIGTPTTNNAAFLYPDPKGLGSIPTNHPSHIFTNVSNTTNSMQNHEAITAESMSTTTATSIALIRLIYNISHRLESSSLAGLDIYPIFVTLSRFASYLKFKDEAILSLVKLIQSLLASPFTSQSGKTLLTLWLYAEYKNYLKTTSSPVHGSNVSSQTAKESPIDGQYKKSESNVYHSELDDHSMNLDSALIDGPTAMSNTLTVPMVQSNQEQDTNKITAKSSSPPAFHDHSFSLSNDETDRYFLLLNQVVLILRHNMDTSFFCSIVLQVPYFTEELFTEVYQYCNTKVFEDAGLATLKALIIQRPPCRKKALEILLELTSSTDKVIRGKALNCVNDIVPIEETIPTIIEHSTKHLEQISEKQVVLPNVDLVNSPSKDNQDPSSSTSTTGAENLVSSPNSTSSLTTALPQPSKTLLKKEEAKSIVQILMALPLRMSQHYPLLLRNIAELYSSSNPEFRLAISSLTLKFFQSVGADSPAILSLLSDFPKGSDNFMVALIEANGPTPKLVATVMDAFSTGKMNQAKFLISILPGLTNQEVILLLPKIVALPHSKLKTALTRLLSTTESTPLTPDELLFHLHTIDVQKESLKLRDIVQAIEICFEEATNVVVQTEVLSVVLHQLVSLNPLPTVIMRTLLLTLGHCPAMTSEILNIMTVLISKQIWNDSRLWPGFLLCCIKAMPSSISVLMQLPSDQLIKALQDVKLRACILKEVQSGRLMPKTILDVLQAEASKLIPGANLPSGYFPVKNANYQ